jgi:hypothetical protein
MYRLPKVQAVHLQLLHWAPSLQGAFAEGGEPWNTPCAARTASPWLQLFLQVLLLLCSNCGLVLLLLLLPLLHLQLVLFCKPVKQPMGQLDAALQNIKRVLLLIPLLAAFQAGTLGNVPGQIL